MRILTSKLLRFGGTMMLRGGGVRPGAGVQKRLDLIREETPDLSRLKISEEDFDRLEADLTETRELSDFHLNEINRIRKKIEFNQVERKYFGVVRKPNMLTWSEKEQIRHLNQIDPELWTPEKLAESFPATVDVIKKLIRSQWIPRDLKRVKKHDKAVSANWKAFESGRLNLPNTLKEHFSKFISRRKIAESQEPQQRVSSELEVGAWSKIVSKCRVQAIKESETSQIPPSAPKDPDTFVLGDIKKRGKLMTLSELKAATGEGASNDVNASDAPFDKAFIMHCIESRLLAKERHSATINTNSLPNLKTSHTPLATFTNESPKEEKIQMKISIPKSKWKKGAIYRLNNCYYSDEGKFLYKAVFSRKN